jgi:hypothetical protein
MHIKIQHDTFHTTTRESIQHDSLDAIKKLVKPNWLYVLTNEAFVACHERNDELRIINCRIEKNTVLLALHCPIIGCKYTLDPKYQKAAISRHQGIQNDKKIQKIYIPLQS